MGWYEQQVVPRLIDVMCANSRMAPLRARAVESASGTVLELGFGSGGNLPHYPESVDRIVAIDPSLVGRRLARKRLAASSIPVLFSGLDGEDLPLEDSSVDSAVSTWTLCTIPDATRAVREVGRVLKPDGRFYFLEHGLADDPKVVRAQNRFDGLEQRVAGGCHLNRDVRAIIKDAGLEIESCDNFFIAGPKPWCYMYAGAAFKR